MGLSCANAINCGQNTASRWCIIALCCNVYKCVLAEISWRLTPNTLPCGAPTAHSAVFKQALKSDTRLSWGGVTRAGGIWCGDPVPGFYVEIYSDSITVLLLYQSYWLAHVTQACKYLCKIEHQALGTVSPNPAMFLLEPSKNPWFTSNWARGVSLYPLNSFAHKHHCGRPVCPNKISNLCQLDWGLVQLQQNTKA